MEGSYWSLADEGWYIGDMAVVVCYECGGEVSTQAEACPHCGAPADANSRNEDVSQSSEHEDAAVTEAPQVSVSNKTDEQLAERHKEGLEKPKNVTVVSGIYFFKNFFLVMLIWIIGFMVWSGFQGSKDAGVLGGLLGLLIGALQGMVCGYFIACAVGLGLQSGYKTYPVVDGKYEVKWYDIIFAILGLALFIFNTWAWIAAAF